ncbi:hypothetical protein PPRY_a3451 [Pseudoalteromonas prydzensis ACAM 620]|nr:hypothetical protein [Pseudoalteromonas prydzensis ACAM 620]
MLSDHTTCFIIAGQKGLFNKVIVQLQWLSAPSNWVNINPQF